MKAAFSLKKWVWAAITTSMLVGFMVLYSYLSWESIHMPLLRFNAPDEQANYFFVRYFAEQSKLSYPESLLEVSQHFVHPRSLTASQGEVKPVGFLGISLIYGIVAKLFTVDAIPFFTPVLAVLTTLFFYAALKRIFNKKIALVSSVLLLVHPAYWYYSSRALMPNILFLDLFIIGVSLLIIATPPERSPLFIAPLNSLSDEAKKYHNKVILTQTLKGWIKKIVFLLKTIFYRKIVLFFWGGFFVASSLTVRLSEVLWVTVLLCLWGLLYVRRLTPWRILSCIVGFSIPIIILLSYNYILYGNILSSGYKTIDVVSSTNALSQTVGMVGHAQFNGIVAIIKNIIRPYLPFLLPFGYKPSIFIGNAYNYLISFFWWYTIPVVAGIVLLLRNQVSTIVRRKVPHHLWYLLIWAAITFWLVIFYGSWKLTDNINGQVTLGVSYVRYWLPSYVMALPFVAMFLLWFFEKGRSSVVRRCMVIIIIAVLLCMSARTVLMGGQESLSDVRWRLEEMQHKAQIVFDHTEKNAVIFSERSDKIFFPERNVAGSFAEFPENTLIVTLIERAPVYYYGLWERDTAQFISRKYFEPLGIKWEYVTNVAPHENLYRLRTIHK